MKIEVKTAIDGCGKFCEDFEIKSSILYYNNKIIRDHRCVNMDKCEALLEAMSFATINAENIK